MADATWTDDGLYHHLRAVYGQDDFVSQYHIRLFKNDFTPTNTSVIADFEECDFDSYGEIAAITTGLGGVTAHVMHSPHGDTHGGAFTTPLAWTISGPPAVGNVVYGYFAVYRQDGPVYSVAFARRFDSPRNMLADGDFISFNLDITLRQH